MPIRAADLRDRVSFDQRALDDNNARQGPWVEEVGPLFAQITWLRGGEQVLSDRLEGRQPVVITIRRSAATSRIGVGWRVRDVRRGLTFNITGVSPAKADPLGGYDVLATTGGAHG